MGEPKAVQVGAGSYAKFPPADAGGQRDRNPVVETLTRPLFIDDSQNGKPVPTNQWWTDLIVHPFGGKLWAHPLVVQARPEGCDIYYPTHWDKEGRDMALDQPLELRGEVVPLPLAAGGPAPDMVIADFEGEHYPEGWKTTGTAFGTGPAKGAWPGQTAVSDFGGKGFVNTCLPNDSAKGTLTSTPFAVQRRYLHFLIGGGRSPDLGVKLLAADGRTALRNATGENSERLKWQTWDLADLRGKSVSLEFDDNATGGWGHLLADNFLLSDSATPPANLAASPNSFNAADAKALRWGDWTFTFRLRQSASQRMDVTLGHGLPFVWVECPGVTPLLNLGAAAVCSGARGEPLAAGAQLMGDSLAVQLGGKWFGLYAPDRSTFQRVGEQLRVRFPTGAGAGNYLIVAALPGPLALGKFHEYAFALPRDSRLTWNYDPAKGTVATTWTLDTAPLKGTNQATLQCWAPHQYREAAQHLPFDGTVYASARGWLKAAPGRTFELDYPFAGLLPNLPCPAVPPQSTANPFDPARLHNYLADYARKNEYGDDTYWGGKPVLCYARYLAMAAEAKDDADMQALRHTLHGALADWFTYTPGEKAHYFARYPRWKALVGFKSSYGSESFNDQHFHYGYFTTATALLGMYDPQFLKDYGPMARLVAKEYANWERSDADYPFLRTFDAWEGHSWAGGVSSANGNNQESSSEAVQSWGGLFLLGNVLGDDAMTAAGAMGYAMEVSATREYWFDYHGHAEGAQAATFSPDYTHKITGILYGGGRNYGTYFSGDPGWIYGIQTLPASPFLNYLGWDPAFGRWQYDAMWADRAKNQGSGQGAKQYPLSTTGALGTVLLGWAAQFDPELAIGQMEELWQAKDPIMTRDDMAGIVYYLAHAYRALGRVQTDAHTSIPTSTVFLDPVSKRSTAVMYNPRDTVQQATVYRDGAPVATCNVPARELLRFPLPAASQR